MFETQDLNDYFYGTMDLAVYIVKRYSVILCQRQLMRIWRTIFKHQPRFHQHTCCSRINTSPLHILPSMPQPRIQALMSEDEAADPPINVPSQSHCQNKLHSHAIANLPHASRR